MSVASTTRAQVRTHSLGAREIETETYQYTVNLDALLTKLDAGRSISQAEARELITGVFLFRLMVTMPPSYAEMVSSGRTELLTDPEIRQALRNFDRDVRIASTANERLYASIIPHVTLLQSYVRHERSPQTGEVEVRPRIRSVDVEGLRRDRRAIAALDRLFYAQTNQQALAHRTTVSVEAVAAALHAAER
jgi:hypothetical protein